MFSQSNLKKNGGIFRPIGVTVFYRKFQTKFFSLRDLICFRMCKTREDIACPLFSEKGSLTVEAALILPLFLLASLTMLSFIDVMKMTIEQQMRQQELLRQGAVYANLLGTAMQGREGDYIKMNYIQLIKLPVGGFGYQRVMVQHKGLVHIFNGYDDRCGDRVGKQQEYVYVTERGNVYHKKRSCSALNVDVRKISGQKVKKERNMEGKIYRACGHCMHGYKMQEISGRTLFVTDYGVKYHILISCPDLTRSVRVIKIEEAGGKRACKFCG